MRKTIKCDYTVKRKVPKNQKPGHKVTCTFCGKPCNPDNAHLHQGDWVGDCCWDPND